MQVGVKGNNFGAGVKHHTANLSFANRLSHRLQTANIVSTQGSTGLDFNPHQPPGTVFHNDVHFLPGGRASKEKLRLCLAPSRLFAQFHQRKVLQHPARKSSIQR